MENNILRVTPIEIGWTAYNGFSFHILTIEACKPNMDNSLFGVAFCRSFLYIDVLFFTFKVFSKI